MSSGKGVYWANKMLDLVLGAVPFTPPANIYAALYNVATTSRRRRLAAELKSRVRATVAP